MTPLAHPQATFDHRDVYAATGLERQQVIYAIANGIYSWAPKTKPGSTRIWAYNELLALAVVAGQMRFGTSRKRAYGTGAAVLAALAIDADTSIVTVRQDEFVTERVILAPFRGDIDRRFGADRGHQPAVISSVRGLAENDLDRRIVEFAAHREVR